MTLLLDGDNVELTVFLEVYHPLVHDDMIVKSLYLQRMVALF